MTLSLSRVIVAAVALTAAGAAGYAVRGFIPSESAGAALRRACASIVDEVGGPPERAPRPMDQMALEVWMEGLAERDPALAPELTAALKLLPPAVENDRESRLQRMDGRSRAVNQYRKSHPASAIEQAARAAWERWEAGAPQRAREEMIRACIVKKGL